VFPSEEEYTTWNPSMLLPETPFRAKFLTTMGLPFTDRPKFFFQILDDTVPAGKC
jgi:hypothetical protein